MAAGGYSITLGYKIWGSRPSCAKDLKKKKNVIKQTVENNSWDESIGVGLVSARGNKAAAAWTSQRGRAMTPWTFSGRAHCFGFFFCGSFPWPHALFRGSWLEQVWSWNWEQQATDSMLSKAGCNLWNTWKQLKEICLVCCKYTWDNTFKLRNTVSAYFSQHSCNVSFCRGR